MKISKYNMPWGVLVAQQAGDMHCILLTTLFFFAPLYFFFVFSMISMSQTSHTYNLHMI